MLVGEVDLLKLSAVISQLEAQIGREINYLVLTSVELVQRVAKGEPFIQNILAEPKVMLMGTEDALRRTAEAASRL
jgi:TRAP-type mannitol/chloroaromatic compound transport system permease small subunit